jgi:hypothetical protein
MGATRMRQAAVFSGGLVIATALAMALATSAQARSSGRSWRVPQDHRTIQGAIDAAADGDEIVVAAGRHCGAEIHRPVRLRAAGQAIIAGCDGGPTLFEKLRVGFLLPGTPQGAPARGTQIQGFTFDGAGVSNSNLDPLAFGIYARFTSDVTITDNQFQGTVQAITNTAGDGWTIRSNQIRDLTLFDCGEQCGGGVGIAIQAAVGPDAAEGGDAEPANRPERTVILHNQVQGQAPAGFVTFPMTGILVLGADATLVSNNDLSIQPGDGAQASYPLAAGVTFSDRCCERPALSLGTNLSAILLNDGRASPYTAVIEGEGGANTNGLLLTGNRGQVLVEGVAPPDPPPDAP